MKSRYTEEARAVLQRAQQIMFEKQHTQLDAEHILMAVLERHAGMSGLIIETLGGNVQAMKERLNAALNHMQSLAGNHGASTGYITLRAKGILQSSAEAASRLGDDFISVEHILLALAEERGMASGQVLADAGIDGPKVEAVIRELRRRAQIAGTSQAIVPPSSHHRDPRLVNPRTLAPPIGFTHGVITLRGRTLYLAGQTALDIEGKLVAPGDIVGQYKQVLANLWAVVAEAGGMMDDIVKMTIFVQDRDDYKAHLKELGAVHKEFFGSHYPATALLEVSRFFDDGVLVEIEGIAVIP